MLSTRGRPVKSPDQPLILALTVGLRYVDWSRFSATTANGDPATLRDVWRYAAVLVGTWSALWGLAQAVELG